MTTSSRAFCTEKLTDDRRRARLDQKSMSSVVQPFHLHSRLPGLVQPGSQTCDKNESEAETRSSFGTEMRGEL